jgi:uncharacterized protein YegP (UPF0339 family)
VKFQVFRDMAGEWRFRLVSTGNWKTLAQSEGYVHQGDCLDTVELIKLGVDAETEVEIV